MKLAAMAVVGLTFSVAMTNVDQRRSVNLTGHRRTPWVEKYTWRGSECWENWTASACGSRAK